MLIGAVFLLIRKYISWQIPLAYIATTGLMAFIFGSEVLFSGDWVFHILSGGLILGAFFMATDYVTSPVTPLGRLIFGVCCGLFVVLIRFYGGYPEGVCYSILIMNMLTPAIDKFTVPKTFGH